MLKSRRKKKVLIVGSNSILSLQLVNDLAGKYEIDVAFSGKKSGIGPGKSDTTSFSLNHILKSDKKYDFVILLSAYIPYNDKAPTKKLFKVNVGLVEKIVTKFNDSRIVFCSTVSVYNSQGIITESTLPSPVNEYGISKLWAEKILIGRAPSCCILRISSLIGPGMKNAGFVPMIINQALHSGKITLFGNGRRLQNYIDVSSLSEMIVKALKSSYNGILFGVGEKSYSNLEVAQIVQRYTGCEIVFNGTDMTHSSVYDNSFTAGVLKLKKYKSIEKSIEGIIKWKRKEF